jgi:hypothetical protein
VGVVALAFAAPLAARAAPAVKELPFAPNAAVGFKAPGKLVGGLRWTDRNGENVLGFWRGESQRRVGDETERSAILHARHYAGGKLLREVKDLVERCEFDLTLAIVDGSPQVTDLDKDGIGEATFAYKLGCRSDVSPLTMKLLVLEGGAKHILRGETRVEIGAGERQGGRYKVDASFARAPAFLAHAKKVWQAVVDEKFALHRGASGGHEQTRSR